MDKLEAYTGFVKYEDFKNHVNSLPKINEEIDYRNNHTNTQIATAIEVVIQIGNLYEDGIYDISPQMYTWLRNAVQILQSVSTQDKNIQSYYTKGRVYLNIFTPITLHVYDEAQYILAPIV